MGARSMPDFDRDEWLDKVLTDKNLTDDGVAALTRLYIYLSASKTYDHRPKQLYGASEPEK